MVAFVLNTAHRLPPIPMQNLAQVCTISCNGPSCFSFSSSCLLILTSQSPFHQIFKALKFADFVNLGAWNLRRNTYYFIPNIALLPNL